MVNDDLQYHLKKNYNIQSLLWLLALTIHLTLNWIVLHTVNTLLQKQGFYNIYRNQLGVRFWVGCIGILHSLQSAQTKQLLIILSQKSEVITICTKKHWKLKLNRPKQECKFSNFSKHNLFSSVTLLGIEKSLNNMVVHY